eukprot:12522752-Alexandrium_andersonii.AAC.1
MHNQLELVLSAGFPLTANAAVVQLGRSLQSRCGDDFSTGHRPPLHVIERDAPKVAGRNVGQSRQDLDHHVPQWPPEQLKTGLSQQVWPSCARAALPSASGLSAWQWWRPI